MVTEDGSKVKGWSGHRYFTLDDVAAMQPGLARVMPEVGQRYWKLYYAVQASNWDLAKFEIGEIEELMEFGAITRPEYEENLHKFINDNFGAMKKAVESRDKRKFEEEFQLGIRDANDFHALYEKPIVWKLPSTPPPDMDFTPKPAKS